MKPIFVLDFETDNTDYIDPKLVCMGYGTSLDTISISRQINPLTEIANSSNVIKIAHNLLFEYNYSMGMGITIQPPYFCTQVACWLLGMGVEHFNNQTKKAEYSYGLKSLAEKYLGYYNMSTYKQLAKEYTVSTPTGIFLKNGKEKMTKRMAKSSEIPEQVLHEYCKKDVEMTIKLFNLVYPKLRAIPELWSVFLMEMQLIPVYSQMQRNGVKVDKEYLRSQSAKLDGELQSIEKEMEAYI